MRITRQTDPEAAFAGALEVEDAAGFQEIPCDGGATLLRMSRSALRRLEYFIRASSGSLPGAEIREIGGIVVGAIAPDGSKVILLDFVPVESEYRFGPDFRPSEADIQRFAGMIFEYSNRSKSVIGYFRTHLRAPLAPRPEDENLMRRLFATLGCSIVLIEAASIRPANIWFCQWDGGDNVRLLYQFPLEVEQEKPEREKADREKIEQEKVEREKAGQEKVKQAAPEPHRSPIGPPPPPPRPAPATNRIPEPHAHGPAVPPPVRRTRFWPTAVLSAAAVLLFLFALFALARRGPLRWPAAEAAPLNMSVDEQNGTLDIKWNPASAVLQQSDHGALDIVDGANLKRVDLTRSDLRAGHYKYTPAQADVTCLLTLYTGTNFVVEKPKYVHLNRLADVQPAASKTQQRQAPANGPRQRQETETGELAASAGEPLPARPGAPAFRPAPDPPRPVAIPRIDSPPDLAAPNATTTTLQPLVSGFTAVPPAPSPPTPSPAPGPPPDIFVEPVVLSRVSPALPPSIRSIMQGDVVIHVVVDVNEQGNVTTARVADATDPVAKRLAPEAIQAARRWRFTPARRNGVPVTGYVVLAFRFAKN